jgi:plastocyanin
MKVNIFYPTGVALLIICILYGCMKDLGINLNQGYSSETDTIFIGKNGFKPSSLSVKLYATVYWKNTDTAIHNVTFDDNEDSRDISPNSSTYWWFGYDKQTYTFHCSYHPNEKCTLVVY